MNDKLLLENYLLILKSTVEVYVHGTLESSNEGVRMKLKDGLNETMNNQASTYTIMKKNGWYKVNNIKTNIINETLNKLENQK